ncbi:MAG: hypothetical protein DRI32_03800 [Chloroflexi bacterium]|nr:MAG: hypothetical protein DRI32_03800 [Chloroflexota bacterium]
MIPDPQNQNDIFAKIPKSKTPPKAKSAPVATPKVYPAPPIEKMPPPQSVKEQYSRKEKSLRALWTITAVISMTVNVIVIAILALFIQFYAKNQESLKLEIPEGLGLNTPVDLLQGLYDNFQLMDAAHIKTNIVVEDTIPVQFSLPLQQPTTVKLSEDVTIYGAYVVINTPTININAPATVTLPAGTDLPIFLDLVVPVDTTIPIKLNVPVDITLAETDLHKPFVGLQDVVQPLYCLVAPKAVQLNGNAVCP